MKRLLLLLIMSIGIWSVATGQATYKMSNKKVTDCNGQLTDSDAGEVSNTYDHNENYTFTICVPGNATIKIQFLNFCTEEQYDYLRIYDGPDTLSPLIGGPYSGTLSGFTVSSTGSCLTINFISDANVVCTGWVAQWIAEIPDPTPPKVQPLGNIDCFTQDIVITLDKEIPCDSIDVSNFFLIGPDPIAITSAEPVGCVNGYTTKIKITLAKPIEFSAAYSINFRINIPDACGENHEFLVSAPFVVNNCPLNVVLETETSSVCPGECSEIKAVVSGGDAGSYKYVWSTGQTGTNTITVCPATATVYTVTVTDGAGGGPATSSITISINPVPVIWTGRDTTICQSIPDFQIPVDINGGKWKAGAIQSGNEDKGWYEPWRMAGKTDMVTYTSPDGCKDTILITVLPLDQGNYDGSCVGADSFKLSGGYPAGGSWTGTPWVSPGGYFNPKEKGIFWVTYTAPNGCQGTKQVEVSETLVMPNDTLLCQQTASIQFLPKPFGGVWSGPGITSADWGWFDPRKANPGINVLRYRANGCEDTMLIEIIPIWAGDDITICPDAGLVQLTGATPDSGIWVGNGIINDTTGMFDPTIAGAGKDVRITYSVSGCTDSRTVKIRNTVIKDKDEPLEFCPYSDPFELKNETVGNSPDGGSWSGPGVAFDPGDKTWNVFPDQLIIGAQTLYYTANGCTDSIQAIVYPLPNLLPREFCSLDLPTILQANPAGSTFKGPGIITDQGYFDPATAGIGTHIITITSPQGCVFDDTLSVIPKYVASIQGLDQTYCFKDTTINVTVTPPGGTFTVNGAPFTGFNPSVSGAGFFQFVYEIGSGKCSDKKTASVTVSPALELSAAFDSDTLCYGSGTTLSAEASGGQSLATYYYSWDNGLGFGKSHFVSPKENKTYIVKVEDGCSDPALDTVTIIVYPEIQANVTQGPKVCYGDTTFATVEALPAGDYEYTWLTNPVHIGPTYRGLSRTVHVNILNKTTGCKSEVIASLPGYLPLQAQFNITPNVPCINTLNPSIEVIDYSSGGESGYWDFGDSTGHIPYIPGQTVAHTYNDTGLFTIHLYLTNSGDCRSESTLEVCVEPKVVRFIPTAFSPNGDGNNDIFIPFIHDVNNFSMTIYDRFGDILFESLDPAIGWDGKATGKAMNTGVYVYKIVYNTLYNKKEIVVAGDITLLR